MIFLRNLKVGCEYSNSSPKRENSVELSENKIDFKIFSPRAKNCRFKSRKGGSQKHFMFRIRIFGENLERLLSKLKLSLILSQSDHF